MAEIPDELVEKAARNAWEHAQGDVVGFPWESLAPDEADAWRDDARKFLAAVWDDLPAAQPTVDRDALVRVIRSEAKNRPWPGDDARAAADALLASGVLTDAAQVRADERRKVAEEIAAAIDAARGQGHYSPAVVYGLSHAARIAREAARSEGAVDA